MEWLVIIYGVYDVSVQNFNDEDAAVKYYEESKADARKTSSIRSIDLVQVIESADCESVR